MLLSKPSAPNTFPLEIGVEIRDAHWKKENIHTVRQALTNAWHYMNVPHTAEVGVLCTHGEDIKHLNQLYRKKNKPTNVLAFPAFVELEDHPRVLGDIIFAYDVIKHEAHTQGKTLHAHISHLSVHGLLHLLNYDHEKDDEARVMEILETRILATMGIASPYEPAGFGAPIGQ